MIHGYASAIANRLFGSASFFNSNESAIVLTDSFILSVAGGAEFLECVCRPKLL